MFIESLDELHYIAGVDLSFHPYSQEDAVACLAVLAFPTLEVVYLDLQPVKLHLPYIPGFLAFREVDPLCSMLAKLRRVDPSKYPQVVLVDGNGRLHPRQFGLASHLGVLADTKTIGVAKNFLQIPDGNHLTLDGVKKANPCQLKAAGDRFLLTGASGIVYGSVVRTTTSSVNPVFVSQGHGMSLESAITVVLACCKFRIPEPIRVADGTSREYVRKHWTNNVSS